MYEKIDYIWIYGFEDGNIITPLGRIVKPTIHYKDNKINNVTMTLRIDTKRTTIPISRLIYSAFNKNINLYDRNWIICHKDKDKTNNKLSNLVCLKRSNFASNL